MEFWKDISEFENLYSVSDHGRILNKKTLRELKGSINDHGYCWITLRKNKTQYRFALHRLVAIAFISNPMNKPQVNHKDGNKLNNFSDNLEWVFDIENQNHATKNNLKSHGINHYSNMLTENDVREIRTMYIPKIVSTGMLAKKYGVARNTINAIVNNKTWKHLL